MVSVSASASRVRLASARPRVAALLALAGWFAVSSLVSATLMARHWLPLPGAGSVPAALTALSAKTGRRYQLVHVLYSECRCSRRIAESILARPLANDADELTLLVGHDAQLEQRLRAHGLSVRNVDRDALERDYGLQSAPLLLIGERGELRYSGGYTRRKQGLDVSDQALLTEVRAGVTPASLPVYGCAVSRSLARTVNPLSL